MPSLRPPKSLTPITSIAELKKAVEKKRNAVLKSQEIADSSIFIGGLRHGWEDSIDFVNGLISEFEASVREQIEHYEKELDEYVEQIRCSPRDLVEDRIKELHRILGEEVKE